MIPFSLFNTLLVVMVLAILYGVLDYRNQYYANIVALYLASLIAWYLSTVIGNGTVQLNGVIVQDSGLGWLLWLPAIGSMIAAVFLTWDAYTEIKTRSVMEDEI